MDATSRRSLDSPASGESYNHHLTLYDDASTDFLILDPLSDNKVACHSSTSSSSSSSSFSLGNVWESYRDFVKKNQITLHLANEAVTRILFWMPHDVVVVRSISASQQLSRHRRWREVCFGLLSLHRMMMDLALQDVIINSYGTTMSLDDGEEPVIPATSMRLCLTICHDVMPTLLELYASSSADSWTSAVARRQARLRLQLERLKFILRMTLTLSYWRQLYKKHQAIHSQEPSRLLLAGLLQDGSMFYPDEGSHQLPPTLMEEHSFARRQAYSGRRTGRRVVKKQPSTPTTLKASNNNVVSLDMARLVVGEVWNMYRPLCWAQVEANHHVTPNKSRLILWWLASMVMDGLSLKCLQRFTYTQNPATKAEWNRRRMKLFLYVLRSPFWDEATYPGAQRFATHVLQRIPLLGRILEAYLWDWIYYWKHPWASERD